MNKKRGNIFLTVFLSFLLVIIAASCGTQEQLAKYDKPENKPTPFLKKQLESNQFEFDWLSSKVSVTASVEGKKKSFKAALKMKNDSVIWASISVASIVIAKIHITPDSVKFLDKINDTYFLGDFNYLNTKFGAELDFAMLQDLMVGNALGYSPKKTKYKSKVDSTLYLMSSFDSKVLKRAVKNKRKEQFITSLDSVMVNDPKKAKKLQKAIKKEGGELTVYRYWLSPGKYLVKSVMIDDFDRQRILNVENDGHVIVGEQYFPNKKNITLSEVNEETVFKLSFSNVKFNKKQKISFNIPSKYEQVY